jgi:predicted MFS family arabinose efflux permease
MRNLRDYAVITASYWVFTLTDGALRMLVLFHLHQLGYAPIEVVSLFLFYEFFGVVTNFVGGWLGARFGLKATLFSGLSLQVLACISLAVMAHDLSVPLVMIAQAVSGVAKDLTKMSSKSYIKFVVPEADSPALMKWIAILTGSKNAIKGFGFLLGGVLLETVGFRAANVGMAVALVMALSVCFTMLPRAPGKSKSKVRFKHLLSKDARVNWLAAARLFLFGARDVWFVFALPIFLSASLGWSFAQSSGLLAAWIIGYGFVQALAPTFVGGRGKAPDARSVMRWTATLLLPLSALAALLYFEIALTASLIVGLGLFGIVFAANSAAHSYLIMHYADGDRVSLNVGFYYMANAAGRLAGTILSGAVFQWAGQGSTGLLACVVASMGFVLAGPLRAASRGRSTPRGARCRRARRGRTASLERMMASQSRAAP